MRASLACSLVLLAGCGGPGGGTDIEASLVFADRTDTELVRLMNAAVGTDIFLAEAQLNQFGDTFDADPCPTVTVEGNVATVTGGCTTAEGTTIEGSAVITNPFGWDQVEDYRIGSDTVYEADAFSTSSGGQPPVIIDGYIRRTNALQSYDTDFTLTQLDVGVRSDIALTCTTAGGNVSCTVGGSGIELVGVGGALVSGTIESASGAQTLDFTLQGADRLTMHRDGTCLGWSIEGTDRGMTCP